MTKAEMLALIHIFYGHEAAEECRQADDADLMRGALDPKLLREKMLIDRSQRASDWADTH